MVMVFDLFLYFYVISYFERITKKLYIYIYSIQNWALAHKKILVLSNFLFHRVILVPSNEKFIQYSRNSLQLKDLTIFGMDSMSSVQICCPNCKLHRLH